jgi:hypothetical protein
MKRKPSQRAGSEPCGRASAGKVQRSREGGGQGRDRASGCARHTRSNGPDASRHRAEKRAACGRERGERGGPALCEPIGRPMARLAGEPSSHTGPARKRMRGYGWAIRRVLFVPMPYPEPFKSTALLN